MSSFERMEKGSRSVILDSDSVYAKHRQEALALINQLRAIGAQADLDLPRIAVIGNQSAGKSSLVEAISGINVPRDAGTCTRCPIECRLAFSPDAWRCKIAIRWEFDSNGTRHDEVREAQFGEELTDYHDVELMLRRAQVAVLNPETAAETFSNMTSADLRQPRRNQLKFSRNTVCVDLSGPQLTDLAFVDLPGIVQNADEEIVMLVEDLVKGHIRGNCLILVTLPMSDDIENQKAMRLAREADPSGLRTIGVLTKPDLVTTAQQKSRWLDVVEGRAHPLKHGYYCTRQPDEDDRACAISSAEARVREADYFLQTLPWTTSAHQTRFGTQNLVVSLSQLLSKVINDRLPTLSNETKRHLADCDAQLAALPAPITSEPSAFVLRLITSFCSDVRAYIQGHSLVTDLVQDTRRTYKVFRSDICGTAPPFVPFEDSKSRRLDMSHDIRELLKVEGDAEASSEVEPFSSLPNYIYLRDVRERIAKAVTRELPNNVPYPAKVSFIHDFQKPWEGYVHKCAAAIHRTVQDRMTELVSSRFRPYIHLEPKLSHIINELIQSEYKDADTQLDKILRYEMSPFTQNEHYLSSSKEGFLAKYKAMRSKVKAQAAAAPGPAPSFFSIAPSTTNVNAAGNNVQPVSSNSFQSSTSQSSSLASPWKPFVPASGHPRDCNGSGVFEEHAEKENNMIIHYQSISCVPFYSGWSCEELRTTDYAFGRKSNLVPAASPSNTSGYDRKQTETDVLASLARLGITGVTMSDLIGKLTPTDEYEDEIEVMAEVRAYFKVAYKRIIDYVPLTIDHEFLFAFADALQAKLIEQLGLGTDGAAEKCAAYLAEDPHIVAAREELLSRKRRLEKVQLELLTFGL